MGRWGFAPGFHGSPTHPRIHTSWSPSELVPDFAGPRRGPQATNHTAIANQRGTRQRKEKRRLSPGHEADADRRDVPTGARIPAEWGSRAVFQRGAGHVGGVARVHGGLGSDGKGRSGGGKGLRGIGGKSPQTGRSASHGRRDGH